MKILIVSDAWHPQLNGVVVTYAHICKQLQAIGHDVHVIGPEDFPCKISMPGYNEIKLTLFPYKALKKKIKTLQPDYIHVATEGPLGCAGRKYCMRHNISFTTSYHTHFPDYAYKRFEWAGTYIATLTQSITKNWVKNFHAPSNAMMVSTKSLKDTLEKWDFKTPIATLTRGADLEQFFPGDRTLFNNLPKPIALYVGRVAIEKNLEDFLEMDWQGSKIIVGDGPSLEGLKQKYPKAIFTGRKSGKDLAEHYRSSDVFVFPSRTDTFGIVIIEALASGLPVAGYNVTGPKDIITKDFLGALDDTSLSKAAHLALQCGSPEKRAEYVKKKYSWKTAAKQFIDAIMKNEQRK